MKTKTPIRLGSRGTYRDSRNSSRYPQELHSMYTSNGPLHCKYQVKPATRLGTCIQQHKELHAWMIPPQPI